jgi:nucleoside-diphosphate-sugar epimerase
MARVLIAGCGYVGSALGEVLARESHTVWGMRRRPAALPAAIRPFEADLSIPISLKELPAALDFVFYLASPGGNDDALYRAVYVDGLRNLLEALDAGEQRPQRVIFASSTAVHAQRDGEWVEEESAAEPRHFSGRRLLEGEQLLHGGALAGTVVRFGGIYGPRRTRLIERVRVGRALYRPHPPQYTNRIHREDCVGALRHLMQLDAPERLYLGVDREPSDEATVLTWLAGALGAPPPRPDTSIESSPRGNKRCRSDRLLASGYSFRYPTFREGYTAVLAELS